MRAGSLQGVQVFAEARRALESGQPRLAVRLIQKVLRQNPKAASANSLMAAALVQVGHPGAARSHLRVALDANPKDHLLLCQMGITYTMDGRFDEAQKWFDRGLKIAPGNLELVGAAGEAFQLEGKHDRAFETIRSVLERPEGPNPGIAMLFARLAPKLGRSSEAIDLLRKGLGSPSLLDAHRMTMYFRLGDLLDAAKDYDAAFDAYRLGNEMRAARGAYRPEAYADLVDRTIAAWTPRALEALPRSSNRSERPVFIVGMPRSGTSLVEQIIASHPRASGAGELEDIGFIAGRIEDSHRSGMQLVLDLSRLTRKVVEESSKEYFDTLRDHDPAAARVTDKMPVNFQHLGLIEVLAPGARVIHCVRNAMDTCLSCYFQLFTGHNMFSYSLEGVGHFYRQYLRLVAHFRPMLALPFTDVVYEDLTADQEAGTRRLIDFVGLEWDDACMRFHESSRVVMTASNEQVRRPMYRTSVERWRRYEKHLGPLVGALGLA